MTKPVELPLWDTTKVNVIDPGATRKAQGWLAPGGIPEKPSFQNFNYWQNSVYEWINELNLAGIVEWDAVTVYEIDSIVKGSNGFLYKGLTASNSGNDPISDMVNWTSLHAYKRLSEYASLSAAVTAIGATPVELWIDTDDTMSGNITIPATMAIKPLIGNIITTAGNDLIINGYVVGDPQYQWISGVGTSVAKAQAIRPEWFGAAGDGVTNDRVAGQIAIDAMTENCTLLYRRNYGIGDFTTVTLDHSSAGGGAAENYNAVWEVVGLNNVRFICEGGRFTETFDPTGLGAYQLFICRDCTGLHFDLDFVGYITLTDAMVSGTNPLQSDGCVVVDIRDQVYYTWVKVSTLSARAPLEALGYDISNNIFTAGMEPTGIKADIYSIDTKYGIVFSNAHQSQVRVYASNNKRSYRINGGKNHISDVIITTPANKFSWDNGHMDWLCNGSNNTHFSIQNVTSRIVHSVKDSVIALKSIGQNTLMRNIDIQVDILDDGFFYIWNEYNVADGNVQINNVKVSGTIRTAQHRPVYLRPIRHSGDVLSKINGIHLDLKIYYTGTSVWDWIYTDVNTSARYDAINGLFINNLHLVGVALNATNSDADADGATDGSLHFRGVTDLFLNNILLDVTGPTPATSKYLVIRNCTDINIGQFRMPGTLIGTNIDISSTNITKYGYSRLTGYQNDLYTDNNINLYAASTSNGWRLSPYSSTVRWAGVRSAPGNPPAGNADIFMEDVAGKMTFTVIFPSGAKQVIAAEP